MDPRTRPSPVNPLHRLLARSLLCLVVGCVATAPAAEAAKRVQSELADVQLGVHEVRFQPLVHGGSWEVVLSGPAEIWLRWALAGGDLAIPLAELQQRAGSLPDGLYSWELIHTPGATRYFSVTGGRPAVQAGYFSVRDGLIVQPVRELRRETPKGEPGAVPNETVSEDLYVVSQACIGDACNPLTPIDADDNFILQQDSTEIFFNDSSTSSFPRRKWRLRANDDLMGGADYFAILDHGPGGALDLVPFRIEGGAPNNSLYVESDGDVGIGTSNPELRLHVIGDGVVEGNFTVDGDFTVLSSREAKWDLSPAAGGELLERLDELPIYTWRYREDAGDSLHLGPTAEDFHSAFGLGRDARHLSPGDAAGVALAAARELSRLVIEQQAEIAALERRNAELDRRLAGLEAARAGGLCLDPGPTPLAASIAGE